MEKVKSEPQGLKIDFGSKQQRRRQAKGKTCIILSGPEFNQIHYKVQVDNRDFVK